jgi:hypothetical protein
MKKLFAISLLMLVTFASCKKDSQGPEPEPAPTPPARHVVYNIGCTDCQVMYYNAQGQTVNEYHKDSNWSYSFDGQAGDVVLLFAYNTGNAPQGVMAKISLNGNVLQEQTNFCPVSGFSFVVDTLQ